MLMQMLVIENGACCATYTAQVIFVSICYNGTHFVSAKFAEFTWRNGIHYVTSPAVPHQMAWPKSEMLRTFKGETSQSRVAIQ